ncbi:16S rRNA processing protein RimM [Chitinophaga skermanii]|uniref:Ribosome maturation factor RimM n=1 Tax=Chitinophaga skermanii TaxID=331697 RepID=A0A327QJT0_9BACT|nr:ribosome maturation factor RimM [Chitinophaga skermanii]RAJ04268.1 16S rRNA processing protein RimM [Chitinophaga skermanii]
MNNYFSIGKLTAAFGINGEVVLKHSLGKKTSLKGVEAIFVEEKKNSFIPYFVTSAKAKDHENVYLKLEGIESREQAQKIVPKNVYLSEDDFKQQAASSSPLSLLGFMANDEERGELGKIEEVIEMPMQVLAKVMINDKEVLLPLNEQTLVKVNKKDQSVLLRLPDGLIDLYL